MIKGRIIKQISNDYTVKTDKKKYTCKARGKFRNLDITPLVGDYVLFDEKNNYIIDILPRKNELNRPRVSNVDQGIIISSLKQPDLDLVLLDKLLIILSYNNIKPIIIFSKSDLLNNEEKKQYNKYINYYKKIGYEIYMNNQIKLINKIFKNKVSVFIGQSGVGKSTLLNKLNKDLNLKSGEISKALNRGKHTTRHTELLEVSRGLVADTPGFSSLDFKDLSKTDIRDNVIEFNMYRNDCKYKDCMHDKEDNCAVKNHLNNGDILEARYNNYIKFIKE